MKKDSVLCPNFRVVDVTLQGYNAVWMALTVESVCSFDLLVST
jgi:hypothetical protein